MQPLKSYIICTNPRSGSWLLSEGLASTALMGNPREWFNALEEQQWQAEDAATSTYAPYLDHVLRKATTQNGVCGVKMHYYQLAHFARKTASIEKYQGSPIEQLLPDIFPDLRFIWLTRRDRARQAISYYRACKTGEWWIIDGVRRAPRYGPGDQLPFDPRAIERLEHTLVQNDCKWQSFFEENAIDPLVIYYEDLATAYQGHVHRVMKWFGIRNAEAVSVPTPRLQRQSDSETEEFLARYLEAKNNLAESIPLETGSGGKEDYSSACAGNPLLEPKIVSPLPDALKQWIGRNKLAKISDNQIIEAMIQKGYKREDAVGEVSRAESDPYLKAGKQIQQRLDKATALLNNVAKLNRLNSEGATVPRLENLSRTEFRERFYAANRPVILKALMNDWPAMTLWTPEYLKRVIGDEEVEITADRDSDSRYEINFLGHRKVIRFSEYVDLVYNGAVTNDYYLVANNRFFERPGTHALLADFHAFGEYLTTEGTERHCHLWFGPAGTVTPLHHDACNILLCQVSGRKHFKLIPSHQLPCVYNDVSFFSPIDCEKPDLERWPLFRDATVIDVLLEAGEALFLPVGWWHHVRTLEPSIMISFTNFVFPNCYSW